MCSVFFYVTYIFSKVWCTHNIWNYCSLFFSNSQLLSSLPGLPSNIGVAGGNASSTNSRTNKGVDSIRVSCTFGNASKLNLDGEDLEAVLGPHQVEEARAGGTVGFTLVEEKSATKSQFSNGRSSAAAATSVLPNGVVQEGAGSDDGPAVFVSATVAATVSGASTAEDAPIAEINIQVIGLAGNNQVFTCSVVGAGTFIPLTAAENSKDAVITAVGAGAIVVTCAVRFLGARSESESINDLAGGSKVGLARSGAGRNLVLVKQVCMETECKEESNGSKRSTETVGT